MAELSLRECYDSQLANVPVIDGQIIFVADTGRIYKDSGEDRNEYCKAVTIVNELPLAPIVNQIYLSKKDNNGLFISYDGASWVRLSYDNLLYTNTIKALQDKIAALESKVEELSKNIQPTT